MNTLKDKERVSMSENQRIFEESIKNCMLVVNNDKGELPFKYFHPKLEGQLVWSCLVTPEGKIISMFVSKIPGDEGEKIFELPSKKEADEYRDELISNGWIPAQAPKIEFGGFDKMSRKDQKSLIANAKQAEKVLKQIEKDSE